MGLAHSLEESRIFRVASKVVDFVRIVSKVVQFFDGLAVRHEELRRGRELTFGVHAPNLLHRRALLRRIHVLVVRLERLVIANIAVAFVADAANDIVALVHPVPGAVDKFARLRQVRTEERPALHVVGNLHSREIHHRRPEVDGADEPVVPAARLRLAARAEFLGNANDQRDVRARIVQPAFGTRQADPVIGPEKDNRILVEPIFFEPGKQIAGPGIHRRDQLVIAFPILSHDGRVGIIRRQVQLIRVLALGRLEIFGDAFIFGLTGDAAFMAAGEIEDRKERPVFFAISPMRLIVRLIPGVAEVAGLVIGLGIVRAVIARPPEIGSEGLDVDRQLGVASHMVSANRRLIHAGNDSRATRCADAGGCKGVRITHAFPGQPVEIRRNGMFIAEAAQVRTDILAGEPKDVGLFTSCLPRPDRAGQRPRGYIEASSLKKMSSTEGRLYGLRAGPHHCSSSF